MDAAQHDRLMAAFDALAEAPQAVQAAELQALAATDPVVAAALAKMLAVDEQASALDTPVGRSPDAAPAPPPSASIAQRTDAAADARLQAALADRYRLDAVLGRGGMGAVYRATALADGRPVALKVLHAEARRDPEATRRFAREARLLGRITHPHVLGLLDSGTTATGVHYVVTEVLHGVPLATAIAEGAFDGLRTARVIRQAAEGLAVAHAQGIVHRDIKPDNLFLEWAGGRDHLKILDFGIAWFAEASVQTADGAVFGTPACMSPEQARGAAAGPASDLYSLGVVAWSCLTGRPLFEGNTPLAVLMQHLSAAPPPLDPAVVDGELAALVGQLLAKAPEARPASAQAVAERAARIEARLAAERGAPAAVVGPGGTVWADDGAPGAAPTGAAAGRTGWWLRGAVALGIAALAALAFTLAR